jgi:hypothetical protein
VYDADNGALTVADFIADPEATDPEQIAVTQALHDGLVECCDERGPVRP